MGSSDGASKRRGPLLREAHSALVTRPAYKNDPTSAPDDTTDAMPQMKGPDKNYTTDALDDTTGV